MPGLPPPGMMPMRPPGPPPMGENGQPLPNYGAPNPMGQPQ